MPEQLPVDVADQIRRVCDDLNKYCSALYDFGYNSDQSGPQPLSVDALYLPFKMAEDIFAEDSQQPALVPHADEPAFSFTRRALSLARHPTEERMPPYEKSEDSSDEDFPYDFLQLACFQSELFLSQSLGLHDSSRPLPPKAKRQHAVVLCDPEGVPFAYEKMTGTRIAYAWRDSHLATQAGTYFVPADSFFRITHGEYWAPRDSNVRLELLEHDAQPANAHFLRFSSMGLPDLLHRAAVATTARLENAELLPHAHSAAMLTQSTVGRQVMNLFNSSRLHR